MAERRRHEYDHTAVLLDLEYQVYLQTFVNKKVKVFVAFSPEEVQLIGREGVVVSIYNQKLHVCIKTPFGNDHEIDANQVVII